MLAPPGLILSGGASRGLTNDLCIKTFSQGAQSFGTATIQNTYTIEDLDVRAVQLVFGNYETTARTITGAIVAFAYGIHTDGVTPLNSAGQPDNSLWQKVAGAYGLTVAAGGGQGSPNYTRAYTRTGWQPVASVGSGLRIFMVRTFGFITTYGGAPSYTPTTYSGYFDNSGVTPGEWSLGDLGRHISSYFKYTSDGITNPGSWSGYTTANNLCPAAIMFRSSRPGLSMLWPGDSLTQGYRTRADHSSWGHKAACAASSAGLPVTNINCGVSGSTSANFLQEGLTALAAFKPSHASIPPWTANDNPDGTSTVFDNGYNQMLTFVAACVAQGTIPVIQSGFPIYSNASANQPLVLSSHLRARAYAQANGYPYVDFYNTVGDATVGFDQPKFYNPAYNYGDTHLNDAGTTQAALAVIAGVLQPYIDAL